MISKSILIDPKVPKNEKTGKSLVDDLKDFIDPSPWVDNFGVFNMMIYSEPGEGKTPLCGTVVECPEMMPALLIDCDSGTLSVRHREGLNTIHVIKLARQKNVSAWKALELIYGYLMFMEHQYKTIILDGGTDLQRYCEIDCIVQGLANSADRDKEHDDELAELSDYRRVQERTKRTYVRFRDLVTKDGRRVNFIATAHEGARKDELTGAYVIQPMFLGKGAPMVASVFDIVARLVTIPHKEAGGKLTKCLVPCLEGRARGRDRSFTLGDRVWDPSMKKIYERITSGLNGRKG